MGTGERQQEEVRKQGEGGVYLAFNPRFNDLFREETFDFGLVLELGLVG
jgi:hypothetical protein